MEKNNYVSISDRMIDFRKKKKKTIAIRHT